MKTCVRQVQKNKNWYKLQHFQTSFLQKNKLYFLSFCEQGLSNRKLFRERKGEIRHGYANPRRSRGLHNDKEFSQPLKGVEDNVLVLRKRCFPKYGFFLLKLSA